MHADNVIAVYVRFVCIVVYVFDVFFLVTLSIGNTGPCRLPTGRDDGIPAL